jgi:two-component system response regulator MprA
MSSPDIRQRYVLVVEDDRGLREFYRAALQFAGFPAIAVEDGLSALHHIDSVKPQAVVLDLGLPRLAGLDVQQELKPRPDTQQIPIVIVSGTDTSGLDQNDFACILRKPVSAEELIAAVERCVRVTESGSDADRSKTKRNG